MSYTPPRGPKTEEDLEFVASVIARRIKERTDRDDDYPVTTELVIELFRDMNDDYDDWWARGLRTRSAEMEFVKNLLNKLEHYDIYDVEDNTFT